MSCSRKLLRSRTPGGISGKDINDIRDACGSLVLIASDMKEMLTKVDQFEADAIKEVDEYIRSPIPGEIRQ